MTPPPDVAHRTQDRDARSSRTSQLLGRAHRARGTERQRLLDEVIVVNLPVARSIARRYRNLGIPIEDLEQVACLALVRAVNRFDPTKADDLLTFAVPSIRGELRRHFRDHGWAIRPPRRIQELQGAINADAADPATGTDRDENSDAAVAARLGVTQEQVREARAAQGCFHPTSIDTSLRDGATPLSTTLVDNDSDELSAVEARVVLRTLTRELAPRDRLILYLRFVEGRTQAEIGEEIGVTQMQVSRLLTGILTRMRERALSHEAGAGRAS